MTAPHEETWTTGEGALSGALYSGDTWIGSFTDPERARLAAQAPKMMRALVQAKQALMGDMDPGKAIGVIHEAMRSAGVPLDAVLEVEE
jgi:hypothetical protein